LTVKENQITPEIANRRSVSWTDVRQRDYTGQFGYLAVGDNPWFCFWNSTVEEFWIFLERRSDGSSISLAPAGPALPMVTATTASSYWESTQTMPYTLEPTPTSTDDDYDDDGGDSATPSGSSDIWGGPKRRALPGPGADMFPKLVKMVEKRKPHSNVPPYCQQMEVKETWQILPKPGVPIVFIAESEYTQSAPKDKLRRGKRGDPAVHNLESMCICEWMSE
jgi:hypothetical protein